MEAGMDAATTDAMNDPGAMKDLIRRKYGEAARGVSAGSPSTGCCGGGCGAAAADEITSNLYSTAERGLRPGGRFAVSDVIVRGEVPEAIRRSVEAWIGCVAGALEEAEYRQKLARAGFEDIAVEIWRTYDAGDGKFASAFVRAVKPGSQGSQRSAP